VNIPNALTLARIVSVPLVVWLIVSHEMRAAFILFLLAGMKADGNLGVKSADISEDPHMIGVVGHGGVIVFGANEVHPHHARIDRRQLESQQGLREDTLLRRVAEHLIDVARLHLAGGLLVWLDAVSFGVAERILLVEKSAGSGAVVEQALADDLVGKGLEVIAPYRILGDGVEPGPGRGHHQFEILRVLRGGAGGDFIDPATGMTRIVAAEPGEGAEEMIMRGNPLRGYEAAHREGVDQGVVERLVLRQFGGRDLILFANRLELRASPQGLRLSERLSVGIDAELVFDRIAEVGLGIDRAAQMAVEIGTLRLRLRKSRSARGSARTLSRAAEVSCSGPVGSAAPLGSVGEKTDRTAMQRTGRTARRV
jgi:hypothetical protein